MDQRERVDGTDVTIGKRVVRRRTSEGTVTRTYKSYSAEFKDVNGRRVSQGLSTRNRNEARRKAIEIQARLEHGRERVKYVPVLMSELLEQYEEHIENKGLAPKSIVKYRSELGKIRDFAQDHHIIRADRFDEDDYHRFRQWLQNAMHKQGKKYSEKSVYSALVMVKQLFKWAWKKGLVPHYALAGAALPKARPAPQPCFTREQVEVILDATNGVEHSAFVVLAYSGMRVGELVQLRWCDVLFERGELGMFHIRRGGSNGTTKDKDDRFVPINPRIRSVLESLPQVDELVLPGLKDRWLLKRLKAVCRHVGYGELWKVHSFRHFFASTVANSGVPYRMAMAWLGHSSSSILDLYYHLHDGESTAAMRSLTIKLPVAG